MEQEAVPRVRRILVAVFAVTLLGLVSAAYGATHYAANNGVDGPACGTSATPCRSITQTMANAVPGDTIMVRPGRYGADLNFNGIVGEPGEEVPAFGGMIVIFKPLIILSTDGAAATILDARNVSANTNVLIVTGNAEFDRPEHGFFLTNTASPSASGIAPQGTNLKVRGNQVVYANFSSLSEGVGVDAEDIPYTILIEGNQVIGWGTGIHIRAVGQTASKNQVSLSSVVGVNAGGGSIVGNVVASNPVGIRLSSAASATGNAIHGNFYFGVYVDPGFRGEVQKSNIFGNGGAGSFAGCSTVSGNWGLVNVANDDLAATHNFWGAATGPGARPADSVCNQIGGTTTTTPFATSRFAINPGFEP